MPIKIDCFKAYDIRGRVPDQLNVDLARRIGAAYAQVIDPKRVVVGHDIRESSVDKRLGLIDSAINVGDNSLDNR